jgi:beta-phosphoglucomutase-like phosphatase (HAD superfamily)
VTGPDVTPADTGRGPDRDAGGPPAILLDLDGTLLDTVAVWRDAYLRLADELDVLLTEDFWPSIAGRSMRDSLSVLGPEADEHDPDDLVARLVTIAAAALRTDPEPRWSWLPGARDLLELLWTDGDGLATGLVTSAWRAFTLPLLDVALADVPLADVATAGVTPAGPARSFGAVVCGDDVGRSKPSPDPYLEAALRLGVRPADCLVIEDSPTGVAAAEAAGMVVLAVPHAGPVGEAPGRLVRADLVGLTLADLRAVHARLRSDVRR